ncbi:CAP domain-containing protein [Prosthecobacter sp.]|uniref:CAP domain-containing protein n=1 Tax=Prosthecobacter sp. TaxID=1965333 RepID=UPI002489647D|nr:CAP domain-containing protein [Prosthecobacter sp.]MDI1315551.1 CAP domain-containing protein [Prosthecobacter sp.]
MSVLRKTTQRPWRSWCAGVMGAATLLSGIATAADPTIEQQYMLELTNRFRSDPQGELAELVNFSSPGVWAGTKSNDASIAFALNFFGTSASDLATQFSSLTAAPPLAWNSALNISATNYSNLMVTSDQQAHSLDGLSLNLRLINGGYSANWLNLGENLFASAQSPIHNHAAFVIDWGDGNGATAGYGNGIQNPAGHRDLLMSAAMKEIGIGFQSIAIPGSNVTAIGPYIVTEHLASQFRYDGINYISDAILTGSVFQDTILADAFYTPGEGLAGQVINVYNDTSGILVASGFSNSAGGYNITLTGLTDDTVYRVEALDSGLAARTFTLTEHTDFYGVPVLVYDNVYESFSVVPEPGSLLLCLIAGLPLLGFRTRRTLC